MTGRRESRKITSMGDALGALANAREWAEKFQRYKTWQFWDQVVGPQIAAHARPHRLRKTVLEVTVDQPVWMQQLQLMKPQLLAKLNARLGETPLEDIFLRRGRLPAPDVPSPSETVTRPRELTDTEKNRIAEILRGIPDPDLRRCLKNLLQKQIGLKKS